ncbi:MAG: oxidoreductase [Alphaproteobacteria bacterium]|nr:oxidoreductase [Alphaproteobacteria bacterium]
MAEADPKLRPYATDAQWEALQAIASEGGTRAAARKLGRDNATVVRQRQAVLRKAAQRGYSPDHDLTHPVAPGQRLRGASTLYDLRTGDPVMQWVKSSADDEKREIFFREAVEAMKAEAPKFDPIKGPSVASTSLCACYPIGDHHTGMLAWDKEAGDDWDLSIAEKMLCGAIEHLVNAAPPCAEAVVASLGDFLHYDGYKPVTPTNGHLLDADSRYPKMVRAAVRAIRYTIDCALRRHKHVRVIFAPGNHDLSLSIFMMELLSQVYENEKRVTVDTSPRHYHYFRFGKNLVGVHHGHGAKMDKLPLIMATDRSEDWGATQYRYWWTGHVHHDQIKDYSGCRVESFRVLPPADAYAANAGYRSQRDMKAIILHREYGEIARHIVNPAMLEAA